MGGNARLAVRAAAVGDCGRVDRAGRARSNQFTFDPGQRLSGTLQRFGFDAPSGEVVAIYDAALARPGGGVTTRRFEARVAASPDAAGVAPALNQAANQIAAEVATWIGSGA